MANAPQSATLIGGGKMGEAILSGWLSSDHALCAGLTPSTFVVADPGEERRAYLTETYGVKCVASAEDAPVADMVILAVKPQVMSAVLAPLCELPAYQTTADNQPLFVSIAAGLATARLEAMLPEGTRLVRVMPNLPLMVGAGAAGVTAGALASAEQTQMVADMFGCMGVAVVVDESQMDAVCAVSGSGPAYVCAMVEAMRDAGVDCGLPADLAEKLAAQTVLGTMQMLKETGQTPEAVRISVCSPGGTTLAALDAMNEAGYNDVILAGVRAADRRSKELGA